MFGTWQLFPCIERSTKSERPGQQMVALFFPLSPPDGFLIDQMKFVCWAQVIKTMSLKRCYKIFDVETALQQPYSSQL